jgi:F0F1-type ATP synthase membrane subunit b/b'
MLNIFVDAVILTSIFWIVIVSFLYTRIKNLQRLYADQKTKCDDAEESRRRAQATVAEYARKMATAIIERQQNEIH